ncbi:MAG: iron-siderophore ABC transporter substrate-binding protein [Cyanobacteria bacterium P01_D01_bin.71]
MFKRWHCNLTGWLTITALIVGCQSGSTAPPTAVSGPMRTVTHANGATQVPASPQRVVVLDTAPLDAAVALGMQPVGTITYGSLPAYLGETVADIAIIGDGNQPNLEAILQLEPDLILGSQIGMSRQLYGQLSQIAPTVLTAGSGRESDWQENFQLYAEALGQSDRAEQLLQRYRMRARQLGEAIAKPEALEISVLSTYSDRIGTYTTNSFPGSVLADIGLTRPPAQDITRDYALEFSAEALDKLDGDYIFLIYSPNFPGSIQKDDFTRDPVWSRLQAVQQGQVCEVTGAVWAAGRSLLAAEQILLDIEACLEN